MLNWLINFSLRNRLLICLLSVILIAVGGWSLARLNIDAFPDTTPVQVQVNTVAPSLNPLEVEQQITLPIELAIGGLPGLENVRSVSKFGFAQVVATFDEHTSIYLARQLVGERLQSVELSEGISKPELGPIATGLGEVFHYVIRSDNPERTLTELRELHEWVVKPELRKVPGVAEVNTWGGFEKQYQVVVEPERLIKHALTFADVFEALEKNNKSVGGGNVTASGQSWLVHGIGLTTDTDQIGNIVIASHDGVPVRVRDVADVGIGHEIRRGAVTADGKGEAVLGLGFMLMGENSHVVTRALKAKVAQVQKSLPADVKLETYYDRTDLVDKVIHTVKHNLVFGALLVITVLFAFLGNFRAGLIVAAAIPLAMLFAGNFMLQAGIAASLLSLGAVDFGLIVDSSVIMVENCERHLAESDGKKSRLEIVRDAAIEVRKPTMFGELIIMIVFLPVLTLEGIEGKLFRPMALTMIFALCGSLILSLTLMPALASLLLPKQIKHREPWLVRWAQRLYAPLLRAALRFRVATLCGALVLVALAGFLALGRGGEFLPKLSEGAIVINVIRLAGISLEETTSQNTRIEQLLLEKFPDEVERVWSRSGTAEVATDPMGIELTDVFATLKPRNKWKKARTQPQLAEQMRAVVRDMPGLNVVMTQPIEMRMNEMIAGIRSDIGIKIYGDDFDTLTQLSDEVQRELLAIDGASEVSGEQLTGQPVLQVKVDPDALARLGLPARDVLSVVEALAGKHLGEIREGQRRFPLVARLPDRQRTDVDALATTLIPTSAGSILPLNRVANITETEGPATINREWGRRRTTVQCNVSGRDVASFVAEAQRKIAAEVELPEGYTLEWGGQFENMQRARTRLMIVVPVALTMIFILLYVTYGRVLDAIRVFTGVPFAAVGGVLALWLRDMPFSVSAGIGFVALSGVSVLGDMVLVSYVRQLLDKGMELREAVEQAARTRLRPVLMTGLVASMGFLPMALSTGVGAEVQRPLATVVIGGVLSSMVLTLVVLPVLYLVFGRRTQEEYKPIAQPTE